MIPDHIYNLLQASFEDTLDPEQRKRIKLWLEQEPGNQEEYDRVRSIWKITGRLSLNLDVDREEAWKQIMRTMPADPVASEFSNRFSYWYRMAAVFLLLALFVAVWLFLKPSSSSSLVTKEGEQTTITLADGTIVWLNENSQLNYPNDFKQDHREVNLTGEAFFEVAHDQARPFKVNTENLAVQVLGTSFNLRAYANDSISDVAVVSGRVRVSTDNKNNLPINLDPGYRAIYNGRTLIKGKNPESNLLAWKERKLQFNNTNLDDVIKHLVRYFGVSLQLENPEISNCQFTSRFEEPELEEVLKVMALSLDLHYQKQGETILLSGQGCGHEP